MSFVRALCHGAGDRPVLDFQLSFVTLDQQLDFARFPTTPGNRRPYSQLTYRSDYSTFLNTEEIASESSTLWISLPCLTTTKAKCSGTGLLGVLTTAVPVQSGLMA